MRRMLIFALLGILFVFGASLPLASAASTTVETQDNKFVPDPITVNVGDTVIFKNTGQLPHTAETKDGTFNTGNLNPGQSKQVVLSKPGTIKYICLYHESVGMVGTIEVQGSATAAPVASSPSPSPAGSPSPSPAANELAVEAPPAPPTEKYFPKIAIALLALMFGGIGMGFLRTVLKGVERRK